MDQEVQGRLLHLGIGDDVTLGCTGNDADASRLVVVGDGDPIAEQELNLGRHGADGQDVECAAHRFRPAVVVPAVGHGDYLKQERDAAELHKLVDRLPFGTIRQQVLGRNNQILNLLRIELGRLIGRS